MRRRLLLVLTVAGCGEPRLPDAAAWTAREEPGKLFVAGGDAISVTNRGRITATRYDGATGTVRWRHDLEDFPSRVVADEGGVVLAEPRDAVPQLLRIADDGSTSLLPTPEVAGEVRWDLAAGTLAIATDSGTGTATVAFYDVGATTPRRTLATGLPFPAQLSVTASGRVLVWAEHTAALFPSSGVRAWQRSIDAELAVTTGTVSLLFTSDLTAVDDRGLTAWTRPNTQWETLAVAAGSLLVPLQVDPDLRDGRNDGSVGVFDAATGAPLDELAFFAAPLALAGDDALIVVALSSGEIVGIPR